MITREQNEALYEARMALTGVEHDLAQQLLDKREELEKADETEKERLETSLSSLERRYLKVVVANYTLGRLQLNSRA